MNTNSPRGTTQGLQGIRGGLIALLVLWGVDAACFVGPLLFQRTCSSGSCGEGDVSLYFWLILFTLVASVTTGLLALDTVLRRRDALSAVAVVLVLVVAVLAGWVLWLNGQPGHRVLAAIYGVDPEVIGARPLAFFGSVVLVCVAPALAWVAVRLAHGRAERLAAPLVLLGTLVTQVIIRVTQ